MYQMVICQANLEISPINYPERLPFAIIPFSKTMQFKTIKSQANPHIREALEIKNKRSKYSQDAFIVEGSHLIEMAAGSGSFIKKVFFTHAFSAKADNQVFLRLLQKKTTEVFEVSEHILNKLADTETPQGLAAIVSRSLNSLEGIEFKGRPFIVVADGIQEPGNLGAIIRTADAAGADAMIILPGTCDAFMPKTLRATAGSIFNMPVVYSGYKAFIEWAEENSIALFTTAVNAKKNLFEADLSTPLAFVFGNEAHGVNIKLRDRADMLIKIPIYGKAESLNVAAAAAVCLYEAVRQRTVRTTA